jgi:flagellar protein FliO/FliZ
VGSLFAHAQEAAVSAAGTVASSPVIPSPTTLSGGGGISILGYILTLLVLAAAAVAMLFRGGFVGMFSGASKTERKLHIDESRSLGHRQYLVVASYEGRRFLLGVCPGSIEYLSGLDPEPLPPAGSFQELLSPDLGGSSGSKTGGNQSPADRPEIHKDAP